MADYMPPPLPPPLPVRDPLPQDPYQNARYPTPTGPWYDPVSRTWRTDRPTDVRDETMHAIRRRWNRAMEIAGIAMAVAAALMVWFAIWVARHAG